MIAQLFCFLFLVLGWLVLVLFSFDVRFFILVFESFYIGGKFLFFFLFFPFSFLSFFFFVASSSFLVYFMEKVPLKFHISCKTTFCVGHINGSDSFDLLEGLFIFVSLSKFMDKRLRPICEKDICLVKFPWKGSSI